MRWVLTVLFLLFSIPAAAQVSACTNAGLSGMQAQLCPVHANIQVNLPPGGQTSLTTLQGLFTATTANGGIIPGLLSAGVITSAQSTTLTTQANALTNTAASLRALLLAINTDAVGADDQATVTTLINGALPTGSTLGISADAVRRVLKELAFYAMKYNFGANRGGTTYFFASPSYADMMMAAHDCGTFGAQWEDSGTCTGVSSLDTSGAPSVACASGTCEALVTGFYPSGNYTASWYSCASGSPPSCPLGSGRLGCNSGASAGIVDTNCVPQGSPSCASTGATSGLCTQTFAITQQVPTVTNYDDGSFLRITATTPITQIHVVPQNANLYYQNNPNSPWLKLLFQRIAPFTTIRYMDVTSINSDETTNNWADRRWPTAALATVCATNNTHSVKTCTAGSRGASAGPGPSDTTVGHIAYEDMISISNTFGKDAWVNMPQDTTDNFACRLFRLFIYGESGAADNGSNCRLTASSVHQPCSSATNFCQDETPLAQGRHMYIEFCNEPWNSRFDCYNNLNCWVSGAAVGFICPPLGRANSTPPSVFIQAIQTTSQWLSWTGSNNHCQAPASSGCIGGGTDPASRALTALFNLRDWNFVQKIVANGGQVCNSAGANCYTPTTSQVRVMYGGQWTNQGDNQNGLGFVSGNHAGWAVTCNCDGGNSISFPDPGTVNNWLWGQTVAPYLFLQNTANANTVSGIFTEFATDITGLFNGWTTNEAQDMASWGINGAFYEGGHQPAGCSTTCENNELAASSYNSGGQSFYVTYGSFYPNMVGTGIGRHFLMNYYSDIFGWSPGGAFGLIGDITRHGSQKYDGIINFVTRPGDVNLDGVVDAQDRAIICGNIGASLPSTADGWWWTDGDLNHDGAVTAADLAIFNAVAEGFTGATCP